jgi:hypothetical protein
MTLKGWHLSPRHFGGILRLGGCLNLIEFAKAYYWPLVFLFEQIQFRHSRGLDLVYIICMYVCRGHVPKQSTSKCALHLKHVPSMFCHIWEVSLVQFYLVAGDLDHLFSKKWVGRPDTLCIRAALRTRSFRDLTTEHLLLICQVVIV